MPRRKYCRVLRYKCDVKGGFFTDEREREREREGEKGIERGNESWRERDRIKRNEIRKGEDNMCFST